MGFKDNRQFLAALEKAGELVRIKQEVNCDLEVAAIARRSVELNAEAVLFENIKDYKGLAVFAEPLESVRRINIAMGLPPDTPIRDVIAEFERRIEHPIKPVVVKNAPCKKNVVIGDDVDLFSIPVPYCHDGDGGRYIGTWAISVTKDPNSDWINWGMHRVMVHDRKHCCTGFRVTSDTGRIYIDEFHRKRRPMPHAVVIGADPLSMYAGATNFPAGESEVDYAGALNQEPVELVKCETIDLLVPAHAEMVIEGEILPDKYVQEGPFGEAIGYRRGTWEGPAFRVKAITYRDNPIHTFACMGVPGSGTQWGYTVNQPVLYKKLLKSAGIPITDVSFGIMGANSLVVGVKRGYGNIATQVKHVIAAGSEGMFLTIVVDEDVDVFDYNEVLLALGTKCHPVRGIRVIEHDIVSPWIPFVTGEERKYGMGPSVLFDCTYPRHWSKERGEVPPRMSFKDEDCYPSGVREKVIKMWRDYGFKKG